MKTSILKANRKNAFAEMRIMFAAVITLLILVSILCYYLYVCKPKQPECPFKNGECCTGDCNTCNKMHDNVILK